MNLNWYKKESFFDWWRKWNGIFWMKGGKEKERLETILRFVDEGVIVTNQDEEIAIINSSAQTFTGWKGEEAMGKKIDKILHLVDEKTGEPVKNFTDLLEQMTFQGILIAKDGTERTVGLSSVSLNHSPMGKERFFFLKNYSRQKKGESEQFYAERLESIELIVKGIAHDFNNLLTSIIGNVSLAKLLVKPKEGVFRRLDEIEKASLRAKDLSLRLMTVSKKGTLFPLLLQSSQKAIKVEEVLTFNAVPGKGKILVIDDEEMIRTIACDMLRHLGYEAETARDYPEALEKYKMKKESGTPFDVVIMDLTVPGEMTVQEAVQLLCQIDPAASAIVSSGYPNDRVMVNFKGYQFKGRVAKPYHLEELREAIQSVMNAPPE